MARPAYIVYNAGQFNVPLANELTDLKADSDTAVEATSAPWFGPKLVGVKLPQDVNEHNDILFSAIKGKGDVFQMPRYFVPYDNVRQEIISRARTVDQIAVDLREDRSAIQTATSAYQAKGIAFGLLPLVVRHATALAVIDTRTGDLLGIALFHATN